MKVPARSRISIALAFFAALVVCVAYLTAHPYLLGVPNPKTVQDLSLDEGWTTADGTPVFLGDLRSLPDFSNDGTTIFRRLPNNIPAQADFIFESENLMLHLFYDDEEVYAFDPERSPTDNLYATHFNYAPLTPEDAGKMARLELRPVYGNIAPRLLDVCITETSAFMQEYVRSHGFVLAESLITIFIGFAIIGLDIVLREIDHSESDLLALGSAIILMGIWSCMVTEVLQLISGAGALLGALEYMSLLFVPYPIVCFASSLVHPRNWRRYNLAARVIATGCIVLTAILFLVFGADMHATLPITHAQLLSCAAIVAIEVVAAVRESVRTDIRAALVSHNFALLGFLIFMLCAVADFVVFTFSKHGVSDSAFFARHGLFVFSAMLAVEAAGKSVTYIDRAAYADKIELIAYTDALTNMGNTTAWKIMRDEVEAALTDGTLNDAIVCQLDVNFLKKVNDTYGHAAGDRYLKHAANTIQRSFGIEGTCYRTGGDEFTVIIAGDDLDERLEGCTHLFEVSLDEQSATPVGDVTLSVAIGTAHVSEAEPHTLHAAQKLADERMYANKRAMKAERVD